MYIATILQKVPYGLSPNLDTMEFVITKNEIKNICKRSAEKYTCIINRRVQHKHSLLKIHNVSESLHSSCCKEMHSAIFWLTRLFSLNLFSFRLVTLSLCMSPIRL